MIKFIVLCLLSSPVFAQTQTVSTVSGPKAMGYLGWPNHESRLKAPYRTVEMNNSWIPKKFSWRYSGVMPPVRDQGQCGSCVYMAITRATEVAANVQGFRETPNLSEQQFLSCDTVGHGCSGSWLESAEYVVKYGLPFEKDFPYAAQNLRCKSGLPVAEKAVSYYLLGSANKKPSVMEIKAAILRYGSVFLTVAAGGPGWSGSGKTITGCRNSQVNHAVLAIGWDEKGFDISNSWGENWADGGYVKIPYDCDQVGSEAGYIVLE